MTRLDADHANLTAAITHLLTTPGHADAALQMIVHLDRFWQHGLHQAECLTLLRRGLDTAGVGLSTALRCEALNVAWDAALRNDIEATRSYATEALQLAREVGDDFHAARALEGLAYVGLFTGDMARAAPPGKPRSSSLVPWASRCCSASAWWYSGTPQAILSSAGPPSRRR